jgi:hypothetical protein
VKNSREEMEDKTITPKLSLSIRCKKKKISSIIQAEENPIPGLGPDSKVETNAVRASSSPVLRFESDARDVLFRVPFKGEAAAMHV